jgi:hypothetical protein
MVISTFYHFHNAKKMSDRWINEQIEQCIHEIKFGKLPVCLSAGDTTVIALEWATEYEIVVATSDGRSRLTFKKGEQLDYEPYERPMEFFL